MLFLRGRISFTFAPHVIHLSMLALLLTCPIWLTQPSTYTHVDGHRVHQYRPVPHPTAPHDTTFRSSGYTHTESRVGLDRYHRVERWGQSVRPYGEWEFPYRPYSVPYPYWGPPPPPILWPR